MSITHVIELHCRVFICILMVSCMDSIIAIKRDKNKFFLSQTLVGVKLRQKEYILIKKIFGLSFPLRNASILCNKNKDRVVDYSFRPSLALYFLVKLLLPMIVCAISSNSLEKSFGKSCISGEIR